MNFFALAAIAQVADATTAHREAANIDSFLIALVVMAIAGLSNWLQNRAQSRPDPNAKRGPQPPLPQSRPRSSSPPPGTPPPTLQTTLERELRRLLGEEPLAPPAAPRPPAPPPVVHPSQVPTAPPPIRARPIPASSVDVPSPAVLTPSVPHFSQAEQNYGRAQQLQESVAQRLRQIDEQTKKHGPRRSAPAPSLKPMSTSDLLKITRNPVALRQAFVASLIFGEPKGMD